MTVSINNYINVRQVIRLHRQSNSTNRAKDFKRDYESAYSPAYIYLPHAQPMFFISF